VVVAGRDGGVSGGRVLVERGPPTLRRFGAWAPRSAPLDSEGRFVLGGFSKLPDTSIVFRVETGGAIYRAQGQRPVADPATGEQAGEILVTIPGNNPDPGFEGTVTAEDGAPVEGALVLVGSQLPSSLTTWMRGDRFLDEARTDAAGRWRVVPEYGPGNASQVLVLHPSYAPALVPVPSRMRRRTLDAVLRRGATVEVRVRDAEGRPVRNAEVAARMRHPHPPTAWQDYGDVHGALRAHPRTDGGGRALVERLGEGSWYLAVRSADGREGALALVEVPAGAGVLSAEVVIATLPVVRGVVRERAGLRKGEPVREHCVYVPGETPTDLRRLLLDPEGRFDSGPLLLAPSMLVEGRIPILFAASPYHSVPVALAEPGVETEVLVDLPDAAQAR
jgi:hypothetical protein